MWQSKFSLHLSLKTQIDCGVEQEAQAAGTLNHPNILAVYDIGTHDGAPYVVSELSGGA